MAFSLAGLNIYLARSFRRMLKEQNDRVAARRTRAKRRTGTFGEILGPTPDRSWTSEASGRAPP
jgi:hypothetical protein